MTLANNGVDPCFKDYIKQLKATKGNIVLGENKHSVLHLKKIHLFLKQGKGGYLFRKKLCFFF